MTELTFLDDVYVDLIDVMGSDESILRAMLVSTQGEVLDVDEEKSAGRINFLMRDHHGSPFEHATITVYVKAPIFVFREWHRHRIASYNEMSGRYTKLLPEFYIPKDSRPLTQVGKPGHYTFEPGTEKQTVAVRRSLENLYILAWNTYEYLLDEGVAKEVARIGLPVGIYSQMYCTMNLRALMNFLSLRTHDESATFVSNPQHEIELGARKLEEIFKKNFPLVHTAWLANGRVAP